MAYHEAAYGEVSVALRWMPGERAADFSPEGIVDRTAYARCWLWVDGRRIYRIDRLAARMVAGSG